MLLMLRGALIGLSLMIAGCQSTPPPTPEISFARYQPIYLDVANLEVIEEYKSTLREPYVEHLLPVSPADAVHVWVKDRLRAAGKDKSLHIVVKDASVVASDAPAPAPDGKPLASGSRRYDARLEVDFRIYGAGAMSEAYITVTAHRSIVLGKSLSLDERKRAFRRMVIELMEFANAEMEKQIFKHFPPYILYGQTP